jgi:diadenosine tetraphosphate (Ap4A) HIT family hydrolase
MTSAASEEDCPFCRIASSDRADSRRCDTILWRSGDVLLVPTAGPLVVGHAMLIPRRHGSGSLSEPPEVSRQLASTVSWLLQVCCNLGQAALYAEHGEGQPLGRPCISHTHVHILPGLAHLVEGLGSLLPSMATDSSTSYMIYGRQDLELRRDASGTRSQYLRRAIARYLDVDTWDYAAFPKDDDVERTIEYWTATLHFAGTDHP